MNNRLIFERINLLYVSLEFCTIQNKTFTVGERNLY